MTIDEVHQTQRDWILAKRAVEDARYELQRLEHEAEVKKEIFRAWFEENELKNKESTNGE